MEGSSHSNDVTLIAGAGGFVGSALTTGLLTRGHQVRCLVRNPQRAQHLLADGVSLHVGDCLNYDSLKGAGAGVKSAYYLVHLMGSGDGKFSQQEQLAASNFARAMKAQGVERVIYLGGLGEQPKSEHLLSRHKTAEILQAEGPPLTYFRAGMVIGQGSASYMTLRYLVERLPAMIAPAWLKFLTQPIYIDDVVTYLVDALAIPATIGREVQIGGPDVISYGQMLDAMAVALGKRPRPKLPVPFITPKLSSLWMGLVTPVTADIARPLVESLSTETVVTDTTGMELFNVPKTTFQTALTQANSAQS